MSTTGENQESQVGQGRTTKTRIPHGRPAGSDVEVALEAARNHEGERVFLPRGLRGGCGRFNVNRASVAESPRL